MKRIHTDDVLNASDVLAQLKGQNELILHAAGAGIYGLDAEGKATFFDPAAAEMLSWESDELIGKPMHAVSHYSKPDGSSYPREECPIYAAFKEIQDASNHVRV